MTTTEKRLGDIADRLDVIAKAIGRMAKKSTQDSGASVQAIVVEHESPFGGNPINLYVCAECNRPIRLGDLYCGKCGKKLVFTSQNEDTKQKETEAEHAAD